MKSIHIALIFCSIPLLSSIVPSQLNLSGVDRLLKNVSDQIYRVKSDSSRAAKDRRQELEDIQRETKELERALYRERDVIRNYGELGNKALLKQTRDYIDRLKINLVYKLERAFTKSSDQDALFK